MAVRFALLILGLVWSHCAAADEPIMLMYAKRAPYIVSHADGGISGLTADPAIKAFKASGLSFTPVEIPTNRQLASIKTNVSPSCGIGWFYRPEREKFAQFTKPIYRDRPTVVLMNRKTAKVGNYDSLERIIANDDLMILVKTQFSYGHLIDSWMQMYKPMKTSVTLDNIGMLRMITAGRADYMMMGQEEASHLMHQTNELDTDNIKILSFPDSPRGNYRHLMCSPVVPSSAIERLNQVIETFQLP